MALFRSPLFLLFLLAASAVQASHAVYYAFGTIAWQRQGFSSETIGALWAFGVIVEIVLFAFSGNLIAKFGAARLLAIAALGRNDPLGCDGVRATASADGPRAKLHAFSFGAAHLAAIHFLTHAVPEDRAATAQGIYAAAVAGLAMGLATIASGPLYRVFGAESYAAMAAPRSYFRALRRAAHAPLARRLGGAPPRWYGSADGRAGARRRHDGRRHDGPRMMGQAKAG